jgi:two-component system, OmpR family, response regulator
MAERKTTVLVVDDNQDFLEQTRLGLEAAGFAVVVAEGEAEALRIIPGAAFDAAVLDLMMEHDDSGFIVARQVKRKGPKIPVILVTAVASETGMVFDATTAEERSWVNADAVLDKPVRAEQLVRELARLLAG